MQRSLCGAPAFSKGTQADSDAKSTHVHSNIHQAANQAVLTLKSGVSSEGVGKSRSIAPFHSVSPTNRL